MKRYIQYIFLYGIVLLGQSCYKDKGNYEYLTLADLYVDTANIQGEFFIAQFDTLRLASNIRYDGDRSNLKYSWSAYLRQQSLTNLADTLSTDENLNVPIGLLPEIYYLEFSAEERNSGRKTTHRYTMNVETTGAGIMVLYEQDNQVDVDLIKTRLLEGLLAEDQVVRQLYSIANPETPLTGNPVGIGMLRLATEQRINIYTEDNGLSLSPVDMKIIRNFDALFSLPPSVTKPEVYFCPSGIVQTNYELSDGVELMVNNGQAYVNVVAFAFGRESAFSLLSASDGAYQAAPFIRYGAGSVVVYDQLKGRFLRAGALSTILSPILNTEPDDAFNFQTIDRQMIYMDYAYGGQYVNYGIFRNRIDNGQRYLYVMDFGAVSTGRYLWDISAYPEIANANLFAFATRSPLAYYAAHNKVYQIRYDWTNGVENGAVEAWTGLPSDEEITMIKLCPFPGRNVAENAKDRYLFVATYNEGTQQGKIYVLQVNLSSGALSSQPVAVYENFGKVKDISIKY